MTVAFWLALTGLSLVSFLEIKGYPLTPSATSEIRPGWEGLSLCIFVSVLVIEYLVCAVASNAIFRVMPIHKEPLASERDQDEQVGGTNSGSAGAAPE